MLCLLLQHRSLANETHSLGWGGFSRDPRIAPAEEKHNHESTSQDSTTWIQLRSTTSEGILLMAKLIVVDRSGDEREILGVEGRSVMEIVRDGGLDDLLALCGGCRACATCHVYVDESFPALLGPSTADENDLLENSSHRTSRSRLSCQITFEDALDGLKVTIAPEE